MISDVVVVGAGGHGREVAEIVVHAHHVAEGPRLAGFVDDREDLWGTALDGVVVQSWEWLRRESREHVGVVVATGRPEVSQSLGGRVVELGFRLASAVSPLAHVSPRATLGPGSILFPYVSVHTHVRIGVGVTLNVGASVSHDTVVGDWAILNPGARLAGAVTVGEGASIGMMAAVIQGRSVGAWSVVGAGAVVVHDLPANVTAVGVPARTIKDLAPGRRLGR